MTRLFWERVSSSYSFCLFLHLWSENNDDDCSDVEEEDIEDDNERSGRVIDEEPQPAPVSEVRVKHFSSSQQPARNLPNKSVFTIEDPVGL